MSKFLQAMEKEGLIRTKDFKGDLNVTSVNRSHADVASHRKYKSRGAQSAAEAKAAEVAAAEAAKVKQMEVVELYKPHLQSLSFFDAIKRS